MNKRAVLESVLSTLSKCFIVLIIAVVICIALSGVRMVKSGEVAVVLRFGKIVGDTPEEQIHKPGILFCLPYFIDEVVTIPVDRVMQQTVTTHYSEGTIENWRSSGYLITGDQNIALVSASAKYSITDPVEYSLHTKDVPAIVNACISNAMIEVSARTSVDDILTSGKLAYADSVTKLAEQKLKKAGVGVSLQTIELTQVSMPEEVRDVYDGVNAATVKGSTMVEEAYQYRNTKLPHAESIANNLLSTAKSEYSSAVSGATSDLSEFWGVYDEYAENPEQVKSRIYNEKMAQILASIGSVRMVDDGNSEIYINWGG